MILSPSICRIMLRERLLATILCPTVLAAILVVPHQCGRADEKSASRQAGEPKQQPEETRKPQRRIAISKKTTYLLQPLDAYGYVDYLAALNQMASQGVTPENNAGVLIVRAVGLSSFKAAERVQFCKLLKIEPLPEQGTYLTEFGAFVEKKAGRPPTKKEEADLHNAMEEPWSQSDFPLVAEWIAGNEKPLDLVVEGTRRPKCYLPLLDGGDLGLAGVPMPVEHLSRSAGRALAARAMLRLGEGNVAKAEQDLLACHRLARLIGSTPFIVGALVAIAIDAVAFEGDFRLMEYGHRSAQDAIVYQRELRKLLPLPVMADEVDASERFAFLDVVLALARSQRRDLGNLAGAGRDSAVSKAIQGSLEWDEALKFGNAQFDKAVAAARVPTAPERRKAFEVLDRELGGMRSESGNLIDFAYSLLQGRLLGNAMGGQMGRIFTAQFIPTVRTACDAETRARTREALGQLGFALSAYRADRAAYPERLNVLAPRYMAKVPQDLFIEQPLHYKRQGDGFLLYSVGANGVDDGGSTFESQPPGDDIVLQIPHKIAKKH